MVGRTIGFKFATYAPVLGPCSVLDGSQGLTSDYELLVATARHPSLLLRNGSRSTRSSVK